MSSELAAVQFLSDEEVLSYTQSKRIALVDNLTSSGVPNDPKDRQALLFALDGLDRAALGAKKIASKEKIADADREAHAVINSLHKALGGRDPFVVDAPAAPTARPLALDESGMPPLVVAPGETETGTIIETSESFLQRMGHTS